MAKSKQDCIKDFIAEQEGTFHPSLIAGLAGASVPYVQNIINSLEATGILESSKVGKKTFYEVVTSVDDATGEETRAIVVKEEDKPSKIVDPISEFSVAERFDYIRKFSQLVIEGDTPSMFFTGVAGVGKTHLIRKQLEMNGLDEGNDYKFIKGHSSPFGLYSLLYHNFDKMLIFDDCDKVFENDQAANLLKAALDSYDKRVVSWLGRCIPQDSDMADTFEFEGQIIFISNTAVEDVDEAVRSRTLCINLAMTREEVTEHMRNILDKIETKETMEMKTEVLDYLGEVAGLFHSYNLRTLIKAIRIRRRYDVETTWKDMVKISAMNE